MLIVGLILGLFIGVFFGRYLLKPSQAQLVSRINDLDVVELSNLVEALEGKFGVSAVTPKATVIDSSDDEKTDNKK